MNAAVTLMYHDVTKADAPSGFDYAGANLYKLAPDQFAAHLDAIARACEKTQRECVTVIETNKTRAPLFLTFDDGGESAYAVVADMLEARSWRGHFFVTTSRTNTRGFLSDSQIRELRCRGHIIGSHSHTHPLQMGRCAQDEIRREWRESVEILSDITGERIETASVPGGYYTRVVAEEAAAAEVRFLFNSEPTTRVRCIGNCTVLGRYTVVRDTPDETVAAFVRGDVLVCTRQSLAWNVKKLGKKIGGESYLKIRNSLINRAAGNRTSAD